MTEDRGEGRVHGATHHAPDEFGPIDWHAEQRWNDRTWVQVALILLIAAGVAIGMNLLLYAAWGHLSMGGVGGGIGVVLGGQWTARRARREVAEESGLSPWQVSIVGRWLRKGHVPGDPKARRAMAALVRGQQRAARQGGRWVMPVGMALCAVGGVVFLVDGNVVLAGVMLVGVVMQIPALIEQRRNIRRLPRIEEQLAAPADSAPPPPSAAV
ncbi:hypothetical protein ACWFRJ_33675 [Streptomyces sp. NPDC055239]